MTGSFPSWRDLLWYADEAFEKLERLNMEWNKRPVTSDAEAEARQRLLDVISAFRNRVYEHLRSEEWFESEGYWPPAVEEEEERWFDGEAR